MNLQDITGDKSHAGVAWGKTCEAIGKAMAQAGLTPEQFYATQRDGMFILWAKTRVSDVILAAKDLGYIVNAPDQKVTES